MIPPAKSAEFFGFYSTSSFRRIFGPLVFGVVGQVTGGSRIGIVALVFFFLAGGGPYCFWSTSGKAGPPP